MCSRRAARPVCFPCPVPCAQPVQSGDPPAGAPGVRALNQPLSAPAGTRALTPVPSPLPALTHFPPPPSIAGSLPCMPQNDGGGAKKPCNLSCCPQSQGAIAVRIYSMCRWGAGSKQRVKTSMSRQRSSRQQRKQIVASEPSTAVGNRAAATAALWERQPCGCPAVAAVSPALGGAQSSRGAYASCRLPPRCCWELSAASLGGVVKQRDT